MRTIRRRGWWAIATAWTAIAGGVAAQDEQLRTDARAPYVHRITLYDADGAAIDPRDPLAPPYSPARTCGKCHAYGSVSHGFHFNELDADRPHGRAGEPWIWTDPASGTVLPLSARGWAGAFAPEAVGLSHWDMTMRFGRHTPGGGFGEPSVEARDASDESFRWPISGTLEIDCLVCHSATQQHDPAERARQIEDENFKWAATAAAGLGVVRGAARALPDDYDPLLGPNPDYPDQQPPTIAYDLSRFDANDRVFFDVTRNVAAERCYFCHSVTPVGAAAGPDWTQAEDIHLTAGMSCVDCHRNDIGHMITRGYDDEAAEHAAPPRAAMSCRGCHLGVADADDAELALGGRGGAPRPVHRGLPTIHFERLTCTACHAGPWPGSETRRVQTSLAHGLGLPTKERADGDLPAIAEPVLATGADGRIGPQRAIWPAYWAVRAEGDWAPAPVAAVSTAAAGVDAALVGEERQAALRTAIAKKLRVAEDDVAFLDAARRSQQDGGPPSPEPYLWPLAHAVRPASQSLGVRGCDDCHSAGSAFYAGAVRAGDEVPDGAGALRQADFQGGDAALASAWALTFAGRGMFKALAVVVLAVVAGVLLAHGLRGLGAARGDAT